MFIASTTSATRCARPPSSARWIIPGKPPLDAVDVITHSTGGLVARTYIQSAAYGGEYTPGKTLPKVNNLIMIGVPNQGASKAWNPLHDNWSVDPAFQMVLSKIINRAYQKVLNGAVISGPDYHISQASITPPFCTDLEEVYFIDQYVPTARALLAHLRLHRFRRRPDERQRPPRRAQFADPRPQRRRRSECLADVTKNGARLATVIYGTNAGDTPVTVVQAVGPTFTPPPFSHPIAEFSHFIGRDAAPGEVYFRDVLAPLSGDGTVPLESSAGQFLFDARVERKPFTNGVNTTGSVAHTDLPSNVDVQTTILETLGAAFRSPQDIAFTSCAPGIGCAQPSAVHCAVTGCTTGIFDPVEGFIVDGQGRRLGFSAATGPLTEILESVWFGGADGIGWIFGPAEEPLTLQLAGLDQPYYVAVSVLSPSGPGGLIDHGFLGAGQSKDLPIPIGLTTDKTPPIVTTAGDVVAEATSAAGAVVAYPPPAATDNVGVTTSPTCAPGAGGVFPIGATAVMCTASDAAGNVGSASFTVTVRDTTAPLLSVPVGFSAEATGAAAAVVTYSTSAVDLVDGARPVTCTPASGAVFAVGKTTVDCSASDTHGNTARDSFAITVRFQFTGFFEPIDNAPALNTRTAGAAVPVKFRLQANQGLAVFAPGSPSSSPVACDGSTSPGAPEPAANPGSSALSYGAAEGQYQFVWKTDRQWAGTCRILSVRLRDGGEYTARFSFRK